MAIRDARALALDPGERAERLGKGDGLKRKAKEISDRLSVLERQLANPDIKAIEDSLDHEPGLDQERAYLAWVVGGADRRPTASSVACHGVLKGRTDAVLASWKELLAVEVASLSAAAEALKVPRLAPAPRIEKPGS